MIRRPTLHDLLRIDAHDVERALAAQAREDPSVSMVQRQLAGLPSRIGAERLNEAMAVDVFDLLAPAWAEVPAVREALARSAKAPSRSSVVTLGAHEIVATVRPILALSMAQAALPELILTLLVRARFGSAALVVRGRRIETVAPRDAGISVQLAYGELVLKDESVPMWQVPDEIAFAAPAG